MNFIDSTTLIIFMLFLFFVWYIYYLYTNSVTIPQTLPTDFKNFKNSTITEITYGFIFGLLLLSGILFNYVYIQSTKATSSFWNVISILNNNYNYFYVMLFILSFIYYINFSAHKNNVWASVEYSIFITFIVVISYMFISSSNLFSTLFLLELIALLIFAKFVTTKIFFQKKNNVSNNTVAFFLKRFSYSLFNSLFFQFWANFVSSILLFFFLLNVHYFFGTSNFFIMNFFFSIVSLSYYIPQQLITFILLILLLGFFIKLGFSPYQYFKIEVYKGIPMYIAVVYTAIYLLVYIYFIIYIYTYSISFIQIFTKNYVLLFIILSIFYLVSLLFDTKNFKAFISYSTLITVTNLMLVVFSI